MVTWPDQVASVVMPAEVYVLDVQGEVEAGNHSSAITNPERAPGYNDFYQVCASNTWKFRTSIAHINTGVPVQNVRILAPLPPPSPSLGLFRPPKSSTSKNKPPPLPMIDPSAGRPPMSLGELTPASSGHGSIDISPRSVSSGPRSLAPWRTHPPRKGSIPSIIRPPSPELLSQDCAFPPFPSFTKRSKTPSSSLSATDSARSSAASGPRSKRAASTSSSQHRSRPSTSSPIQSSTCSRKPSYSRHDGSRQGSVDDHMLLVHPTTLLSQPSPTSVSMSQRSTSSSFSTRSSTVISPATTLSTQSESASGQHLEPVIESPAMEQLNPLDRTKEPPSNMNLSINAETAEPAKRMQRPPPIATGKSMPLLHRFKTILTPRRAPTAPIPSLRKEALAPDSPSTATFNLDHKTTSLEADVQPHDHIAHDEERHALYIEPSQPDKGLVGRHAHTNSQDCGPRFAQKEHSYVMDGVNASIDHKSVSSRQRSIQGAVPEAFIPVTVSSYPGLDSHKYMSMSSAVGRQPATDDAESVYSDIAEEEEFEPPDNHSILQDHDIEDLEDMVSPAPASGERPQSHGQSRYSTASASSYDSVSMSQHSVGSKSSIPRRDGKMSTQSHHYPTDRGRLNEQKNNTGIEESFKAEEAVGSTTNEPMSLSDTRSPQVRPDAPTDIAIPQPRLSPSPPFADWPSPLFSSPNDENNDSHGPIQPLPPSPQQPQIKGTCRGCANVILTTQRSVSSADGRLSGRYHRTCFVCKTCRSPFPTADFYVHDDQPYCAQHYHELNGTICGGCNTGIEGQYMDTSTVSGQVSKKYHLQCLVCTTCHMVLKEDYFEFNDLIYCEDDAWRVARSSIVARPQHENTSKPKARSPLGRELVTSEQILNDNENERGKGDLNSVAGRFLERRLTRLIL